MPWASENVLFIPALVLLGFLLIWKGGSRGLLCVLMLILAVSLSDAVCNIIKHALSRPRPFLALADAHLPPTIGRGGSGSMPSSHAANWFSGLLVALIYYRRSRWLLLPAATLVSFSRVYNGVHYPSDVMAGAIVGAGSAAATLWLVNSLWQRVGQKMVSALVGKAAVAYFSAPRATGRGGIGGGRTSLRQLLPRVRGVARRGFSAPHVTVDSHWLRLGYLCIVASTGGTLVYLAERGDPACGR